MPQIMENLQLACAICRIGVYSVCRRLCCKADPPPKPEFSLLCLGLSGAGKTTLLTSLAGESLEDILPTTGFIIKCCQMNNCILNVKEVGGGPKVRQFWHHYFSGMQGLVFVVDSSASADELEESSNTLHQVLQDPLLAHVPCLILANCQDKTGACSEEEITETFDCETVCSGRDWAVCACTMKDINKLRDGIQTKFMKFLMGSQIDTTEGNIVANASADVPASNRL